MRVQKAVLAAIVVSLSLAVESSYAGSKPATNISTSSTFGPGGQIGSDGRGTYLDRVDGVQSMIDASPGNLHFCMGYYASRTPREAYLDLSSPAGADSVPMGVTQNDTLCFNITKIRDIPIGSTMESRASLGFTGGSDGAQYALEWGFPTGGTILSNTLWVTRRSATQWYIEAVPGSIAELVSVQHVQGSWVYTHVGTYNVTFNLTVNAL